MTAATASAPHLDPQPEFALELTGLTKTYAGTKRMPPKQALKGVDLKIRRGSMFGLLGPNGAGKSTLINILAGLSLKSGGKAVIWGRDIDERPRDARAALGVVPQELAADVFFTPKEAMEVQAGFYGVPKHERRTMELLDALGLADKANAPMCAAESCSGGMKRQPDALRQGAGASNPPILILDEPTAGVPTSSCAGQLWASCAHAERPGRHRPADDPLSRRGRAALRHLLRRHRRQPRPGGRGAQPDRATTAAPPRHPTPTCRWW